MLTSPITTPLFQSRVLALLSNHLSDVKNGKIDPTATPKVAPLSAADTPLIPGEVIQQLVGVASPWIDLSSPDPVVFDISRQVLELEVQYAAFCGLGNVIVPGPRLQYGGAHGEGITQYAFAIQDALALSNFTQLLIHLPMMYHPDQDSEEVEGSLVPFARPEYIDEGIKAKHDFLGTWDAWQVIRSICKYHFRLFVGKNMIIDFFSLQSHSSLHVSFIPFRRIREASSDEEHEFIGGSLEVLPSASTTTTSPSIC